MGEMDLRIEGLEALVGLLGFGASAGLRVVKYLALEVGEVDLIRIDDADVSDACGCKIQQRRRSETSRSDDKEPCLFEALLPLESDLGEDELSCITKLFCRRQRRNRVLREGG